jgi:hypothetical protein
VQDLLFLAFTVGFFGACWGLVLLFERLEPKR